MAVDQIVRSAVFVILTLMTLGGGVGVVSSRNIFHSALFLVLSFAGVVGYYVLLDAGFLAVVQLLIYIGAIAILILFAIMVSRGLMAARQSQHNQQWWIAALVSLLIFVVLIVVVSQVDWPIAGTQSLAAPSVAVSPQDSPLGRDLLGPYVIPFEVASILLLVALIGAVILAQDTES